LKLLRLAAAAVLATGLSACSLAPLLVPPPQTVPQSPATVEVPATPPVVEPLPTPAPVVEVKPWQNLNVVMLEGERPLAGVTVVAGTESRTTDGSGFVNFGVQDSVVVTITAPNFDTVVTNLPPGDHRVHLTRTFVAPAAPRDDLPPTLTGRALVGPLRVQSKLFRDDTGFRRVMFASWFTALRVYRENPAEFQRQIDVIADAGYQGARVFLAVGGWSDYWDNHEVVPIPFQKWFYTGNLSRTDRLGNSLEAWPDYDTVLRGVLREFKKRHLRLDVTFGDMQIIVANDQQKELVLHRHLSQIAAEEGGLEVIALVEGTNEFPINRYGGDSDESVAQLGRLLEVWQAAIPGVLTTEGAVISEEPPKLLLGARFGTVAAVHVSRDPVETFVKRTFGLTNWEGNWRFFPVPFWHTEPLGPGKDSFAAQNDPANLTAAYAMPILLGHAINYFNGPAVRAEGPLESTWGFRELPRILSILPEDVGTWDHASDGHGGIMYFFHGQQFATASVAPWATSPPRPVADWTLYAGDSITSGTGNPPLHVTGLLVGHFQ
jgi:hypothetical protein